MTSQDLFTQSLKDNITPGILKNREERKKLVDDIQNLKKLRANINQSLGYYKIARTFPEKSFVDCEDKFVRNLQKVPDGLVILKEELYRYSGIYCANYEQDMEYRFEFHSCKNISKSETYFVQILTEEEMGKLGFWKMPLLLDVNVILSKCPIEDMRQVKSFVKLCKYYLDCQNSRKTQFEDLKTYVEGLHTCSLQANLEIYTNIQLQMFMLREIETDKCYDIVLYIVYELTDSRPNKLIPDSIYEEKLPGDVIRKLKKFFKKFRLLELKSAFEEIVDEENEKLFQWQKSFKDKDIAIENDEVDSDEFSQGEENYLSEMRSLTEEKENKEGVQKNEEDSEANNKKLKKTSGKRKMGTNKKLEDTQSANKKIDDKENSTIRRTKKIDKICLEEENNTKEKEDELYETNEEDLKKRQIKKKIRRKVKAKVFKTVEKLGKQTKLDFSSQDINTDHIQEVQEKEGTDEIQEATQHTLNPKNNQEPLQGSPSKNKFESKDNEIIKIEEKSHEAQIEEEISTEQNENPRSELRESELVYKNQTNIHEIKNGRKTVKEKKDKNQNQIISEEKDAKKNKKKFKRDGEKTIKSSLDLPNVVLEEKKLASSSTSANIVNPISLGENIAKRSARIKRQQTHPQTETGNREINKVNKPNYKSPQKRPRSDSSDSDHEVFEEPEQSLLKNLAEIHENILKSSAGIDNNRGKKLVKRVQKVNKKAKKL